MAININVQVARAVPQTNTEGLTLVIFKNARKSSGITENIIAVNSLTELTTNFDTTANTTLAQQKELYVAEYLIRAGVNLLCYSVLDPDDGITEEDIANIRDFETLNYKMVVAPYDFITADNTESDLLGLINDIDAQLFLDLHPALIENLEAGETIATEVAAVKTALSSTVSAKVELFTNAGLPAFKSNYSAILTDFNAGSEFYGIPSSAAAVARKSAILGSKTPWLPIAGETYGKVDEFTKLYLSLTTLQKEAFQAKNINVLFTKIGVGNIFVSQNTLFPYEVGDEINPLIRSHAVTESLYVKRLLNRYAEGLLFAPNNYKTWNAFSLKARSLFESMLEQEGIEDYSVQVGRGVTMTEDDIANGIFKAVVTFLPIRVIESVTFNIVVQETADSYVVQFTGGDL